MVEFGNYFEKARNPILFLAGLMIFQDAILLAGWNPQVAGGMDLFSLFLSAVGLLGWIWLGFEFVKNGLELKEAVIGSCIYSFLLALIGVIWILVKMESGMGGTDVTQMVAVAAMLGTLGLYAILAVSIVIGVIFTAVLSAIGGAIKKYIMK